ncbi:MAG TPA: hypothetical protein VMV10_10995 [Pirellulales bacterium]|nr:hypothetical protein [Pirellulales bacterium]
MSHDAPVINEAYRIYVRILRRLHQLEVAGQAQSPEAAELESQLEDAWEPLTSDQRESVAGLGSDLNWIRRGLPPRGTPKEKVQSEDLKAVQRAIQANRPREVLWRLRHCAAAMPQAELARLRGDAWAKLGEHETALLFFEHATRLDPTTGSLASIALDAIGKADPQAR